MFNALTFDSEILSRTHGKTYSYVHYVGRKRLDAPNVKSFFIVDEDYSGGAEGDIYLSSPLLPDEIIDEAIALSGTAERRLIINACDRLDEVGVCDKKYGMSPIARLHSLGLLDGNYITGAVYVDKDDIQLIIDCAAQIILTPSLTLGSGCGIPPVRMLQTLGATVKLGTGTRKYNPTGDLVFEQRLIALAASGALCTADALSTDSLKKMITYP